MKPILIGVAAYVLLTMVMGYVWNIVVFHETYSIIGGPGRRKAPIVPLGVASMLLEAIALAILFSKFFQGTNLVAEGLSLGLLAGAFSVVYAALVVPAKFAISPIWKYAGLELVFGLLHFALAGVLFAYIFLKWGGA